MDFRDLFLFYIVTGISLRWIATAATVGASAVGFWLVALCAFYLPHALSVMELSSRYPEEGGLYVWTKRAFGEFPGFMTGWSYWASNLPYYPAVLYFAAIWALSARGWPFRRVCLSSQGYRPLLAGGFRACTPSGELRA